MIPGPISIADYDYDLPQERIASHPLPARDASRMLIWKEGRIRENPFHRITEELPPGTLLVFNNTKVIRARLMFFKETGARIELFCLEPLFPATYEQSLSATGSCRWLCMVGNLKKWKGGPLRIRFGESDFLSAQVVGESGKNRVVQFRWDSRHTFGELLEKLGKIPIPPYLNRESEESDLVRYQTVYSKIEGSVAAPTAGLHFTPELLDRLRSQGVGTAEITLHVGAGTFLPVKDEDASRHEMHTEVFEVTTELVQSLIGHTGRITAVGTTSVRTLESLPVLGYRILKNGDPEAGRPVDQWEAYDIPDSLTAKELLTALAKYMERGNTGRLTASTRMMITPAGFHFRVADALVTNFHQPKSTLLLLVSAFTGSRWRTIYDYALAQGFRFLSYGDSSVLFRESFRE